MTDTSSVKLTITFQNSNSDREELDKLTRNL